MIKYKDVFSRDVRATPANLTPFDFTFKNKEDWENSKNCTGRRRYDLSRQIELQKIITKLLEAGVI